MTNYIDKPDSEYTYQDWLTFVQTNTPEDVARDMLRRRRDFDMYYELALRNQVVNDKPDYFDTVQQMAIDETKHEYTRLIEYAMSQAYAMADESHQRYINHCVVTCARKLATDTDNPLVGEPESE